jgi:hypothetical protein
LFTARHVTIQNCNTYNTANDGFDIKEGASFVKIKNSFASWPVGGSGAWGATSVGNSGYYLRGNDIQIIDSGSSNSAEYPGIKLHQEKTSVGAEVTVWCDRVELKALSFENIADNFGVTATNARSSERVTIYSDYTLQNVPKGIYDNSTFLTCHPLCLSFKTTDEALFTEMMWDGIGGRRLHPDTAPSAEPTSAAPATAAPSALPTTATPTTAMPSAMPTTATPSADPTTYTAPLVLKSETARLAGIDFSIMYATLSAKLADGNGPNCASKYPNARYAGSGGGAAGGIVSESQGYGLLEAAFRKANGTEATVRT